VEEVGEEVLAVACGDVGSGAHAGQWEAIADRHDVRLGLADADDKAGECTCSVDLHHGPVEGAECCDVEAPEDLARALEDSGTLEGCRGGGE
jgi:hypothetical protein